MNRLGVLLFTVGSSLVMLDTSGLLSLQSWQIVLAWIVGPALGALGTLPMVRPGVPHRWRFLAAGTLAMGGVACATQDIWFRFVAFALYIISAVLMLGTVEDLSRRYSAAPLRGIGLMLFVPILAGVFLSPVLSADVTMCSIFASILAFTLVYSLALGRLERRLDELGESRNLTI